jgi:hypothetical protein
VPHDVPLGSKLVETAYDRPSEAEDTLGDFTAADFSAPADDSAAGASAPALAPASKSSKAPELPAAVTVSVDEGGDITVPDFMGQTMRDVTDQCLRLGLNPALVGTSLAIGQTPAAGAKLQRGGKVTVEFATRAPNTTKAAGKSAELKK